MVITRSIKMVLKKINEACEEKGNCDGCPFINVKYGCFFLLDEEGKIPADWDFDLLKGEEE